MADHQQHHHHHRPSLKQTNKAFKSKHASKGSLRDAAKGRLPSSVNGGGKTKGSNNNASSTTAAQLKANRRNTAKQLQAAKRAAIVAQNRVTSGSKNEARAPRVVAVVPLCSDLDSAEAISQLVSSADLSSSYDTSGNVHSLEWVGPSFFSFFCTCTEFDRHNWFSMPWLFDTTRYAFRDLLDSPQATHLLC